MLILFFGGVIKAQESKCALKLNELPESSELFGFRAGMTSAEVKTRVPQIVFGKTNEFGFSQTSISPDFDPRFDKASFAGIRTVSLDFLDNRLTSIWFGYDGTYKWQSVPEYVKGISKSLKLPNAWTSWKVRGQRIVCVDFEMTVTIVGEGPSFHIVDSSAEQIIGARRAAKDELESSAVEAETQIIADKQTKVYYTEGCRPTKEIKEIDRVSFKTIGDAESAGYKLAKACQ